uniref:Plac8 onzin related protein 2 n=1 Tax=Haplochromis burtoni TaxID=8153 RepID=A0A3Q2VKS7_HAPBU
MLFLFSFRLCSLLLLFFFPVFCVTLFHVVIQFVFVVVCRSGCFACRTTQQFGQCLCLPLLDVFGCVLPITMSIRVSLRQRYGIKGNLCTDCWCSTFCPPCVWCQMATEMKKQKLPTMQ